MNRVQVGGSEECSPRVVVTHNRRNKPISGNTSQNSGGDINIYVENVRASDSAVYAANLCKSFGSQAVIQNFCMNVRKGTIYGLLGASGCGKTTILSCIVGLQKWDSGDIRVFGHRPGTKESGVPGKRLGYMPQDLALYEQLSIRETIRYYGRIYNMSSTEITEHWLFLVKLLKLPSNFKLIGNLSGGQKRRASLALALVHSPELLVLDEPTVGLDPLLRRSIWNHLFKIVKSAKTTILLTTHYVEEARLSNTIGVIRYGRLLVEQSPDSLLQTFNCTLLEQVVLQLCRKDEKEQVQNKNCSNHPSSNSKQAGANVAFKSPWKEERRGSRVILNNKDDEFGGVFRNAGGFDCDDEDGRGELSENLKRKEERSGGGNSLLIRIRNHPVYTTSRKIQALMTVMWLTFIRHPVFITLVLLLPTIHGSVTLIALGSKPKSMNFGIINYEVPGWESECAFASAPPLHNNSSPCDLSGLSCRYLNEIRKDSLFNLVSYGSAEQALQDAQLGKVWGFLSFSKNFSQDTFDVIAAKFYSTRESLEGSRIPVRLDFSQFVGAMFLTRKLFDSYQGYVEELAKSCDIGASQIIEVPLNFRAPVYGTLEDDYTTFLMPGVYISCVFGLASMLTCLMFINDRKSGTLSRAHVAGLGILDVMISHVASQALMAVAQIALWTSILHFGFGLVVHGSAMLYFVISVLAGLTGALMGIVIGSICETEVEGLIVGVFISPILLVFGVLWPLEAVPRVAKYMGYILPTTLPTASLRSVVVRGAGLAHVTVWPGVVVMLVWIALFSLISTLVYRKTK